jgi:hypothetical protein
MATQLPGWGRILASCCGLRNVASDSESEPDAARPPDSQRSAISVPGSATSPPLVARQYPGVELTRKPCPAKPARVDSPESRHPTVAFPFPIADLAAGRTGAARGRRDALVWVAPNVCLADIPPFDVVRLTGNFLSGLGTPEHASTEEPDTAAETPPDRFLVARPVDPQRPGLGHNLVGSEDTADHRTSQATRDMLKHLALQMPPGPDAADTRAFQVLRMRHDNAHVLPHRPSEAVLAECLRHIDRLDTASPHEVVALTGRLPRLLPRWVGPQACPSDVMTFIAPAAETPDGITTENTSSSSSDAGSASDEEDEDDVERVLVAAAIDPQDPGRGHCLAWSENPADSRPSQATRDLLKQLVTQLPLPPGDDARPFEETRPSGASRSVAHYAKPSEAVEASLEDIDGARMFNTQGTTELADRIAVRMHRASAVSLPPTLRNGDAPRSPTDCAADWLEAVDAAELRMTGASARIKEFLANLREDAQERWIFHDFAPDGGTVSNLEMASRMCAAEPELRELSTLATQLATELKSTRPERSLPLLYDNPMMRIWETALVQHLINDPPPEVLEAAKRFGEHLSSRLQALDEADPARFHRVALKAKQLMAEGDRRFWLEDIGDLHEFTRTRKAQDAGEKLIDYFNSAPQTGPQCVALYSAALRTFLSMSEHARAHLPWGLEPRDDQDQNFRAIPPERGSASRAHPPPAAGSVWSTTGRCRTIRTGTNSGRGRRPRSVPTWRRHPGRSGSGVGRGAIRVGRVHRQRRGLHEPRRKRRNRRPARHARRLHDAGTRWWALPA